MIRRPPRSPLFPYPPLFRSDVVLDCSALEPQITWGTDPSQVVGISGRVPDPAGAADQSRRAAIESALKYMGLTPGRSEEHTSELQSQSNLVCRLLLENKKGIVAIHPVSIRLPAHPGVHERGLLDSRRPRLARRLETA